MFRYLFNLLTFFVLSITPAHLQANNNNQTLTDAIYQIEANVIFMRHALAPGFGDPAHFDVNQCDTQRNLDDTGRQQAQFIGQYLKTEQLIFTDILSSQWCRCKETASELGLGDWHSFAGLNSFFQDHADRTETLALLSGKLDTIHENELVLMITHQVVISAVTGHSTRSGGLILYNTSSGEALPFSIRDL